MQRSSQAAGPAGRRWRADFLRASREQVRRTTREDRGRGRGGVRLRLARPRAQAELNRLGGVAAGTRRRAPALARRGPPSSNGLACYFTTYRLAAASDAG